MGFRDEPLLDQDRSSFDCGVPVLNNYLRQQAGQDRRRNIAVGYVLMDVLQHRVAGYYTLSAFTVAPAGLDPGLARRLPNYEVYPALLIGRLALDTRYRGKGVGKTLLASALRRCLALSGQMGAVAVVVDAKDDEAFRFYTRHGFLKLEDHPMRLYIPMRSIAMAVNQE
ncbi:MAG: GNAT family N-acetyltransferase [Candidatus Xenobia bacterium]